MHEYKTNIKCGGCVSKVKPYLDAIKDIKSWSVDLASAERILTVEGEVSEEAVEKALAAAGYHGEMIN